MTGSRCNTITHFSLSDIVQSLQNLKSRWWQTVCDSMKTLSFKKVYKDTKLEGIKEALHVIYLLYRLHNKSQVALLRKLEKKSDLHSHFNKSLFFHKNRFYKVCRTKRQTNTWLCACVCWETLWLNTPATIASTTYLELTKGWYRGKKKRGRKMLWSHQWLFITMIHT